MTEDHRDGRPFHYPLLMRETRYDPALEAEIQLATYEWGICSSIVSDDTGAVLAHADIVFDDQDLSSLG